MKAVLVILALLGQDQNGRPPQPQEEPGPQARPEPARKPTAPRINFRARMELAYDDNVVNLSRAERREFREGSRPERYRIDSADDLVAILAAEADARVALFGPERDTEFGGRVEAHLYASNTFINWQEYRLWGAVDVGPDDRLRLTGALVPERYRREMRQPATGEFSSALSREMEVTFDWRRSLSPQWTIMPFLGWRREDFNNRFDYRDEDGWFLGARATYEPSSTVEASLTYEYVRMGADAGDGEPDFSHLQHRFEPSLIYKPTRDVRLYASWQIALRDFTTSRDLERVDRSDLRQRWTLGAEYRLARRWDTWVELRHRSVASDRPNDNVTAAETDYTRTAFMVGVSYRY